MRRFRWCGSFLLLSLGLIGLLAWLPAGAQVRDPAFPAEDFVQINPTLPNEKLDFNDDSQESCCAKDYTPAGQPVRGLSSTAPPGTPQPSMPAPAKKPGLAKSEFERSNPRYVERNTPMHLVACDEFEQLPQLASNAVAAPNFSMAAGRNNLPVTSYSTNVSHRQGAEYFSDPRMRNTSDFHIQTVGGAGMVRLQDVNSYSVCMGRGGNIVMVANTDNGSILTYNGNDTIYLAGNNTNMLTRTGGGEDVIELHQAHPVGPQLAYADQAWSAYNIYKTAVSGGSGEDTLVIRGTPFGTKWCHIGGYRMYGEYFYVVEFALPPTVTEGPRRQRVNIGQSVEYVVFKGKKYRLNEFLVHGEPVDAIARSVPLGDPLPKAPLRPVSPTPPRSEPRLSANF
jgi:hypothetical protein